MTKRYSKFDPCPACGKIKGCAESDNTKNGVLCISVSSPESTPNGWSWIKYNDGGMGSLIVPESDYNSYNYDDDRERERYWEREQARIEREERRNAQRQHEQQRLLSVEERDIKYRMVLDNLTLSDLDTRKLSKRGLSSSEIEKLKTFGFRTWEKKHIPGIGDNLAGAWEDKLKAFWGFFIPAYTPNNQIVGGQIAMNNPNIMGKYIWLSSKKDGGNGVHLPGGELPLFVWKNPESQRISEVWLCEGALKSAITAVKLWGIDRIRKSFAVIGTAQSASYPDNLLKEYLQQLAPSIIRIMPDAGSLKNSQIFNNNLATAKKVASWGYEVKIGWWNQATKKDDPDIDELLIAGRYADIKYISVEEFIGYTGEDNREPQQQESPNTPNSKINDWARKNYNLIKKYTPDVITEQRYLMMNEDEWLSPVEGTLYAIKGGMGQGKTHLLQHWVNGDWKDEGIICLGYRNGLLYQLVNKLQKLEHLHDKDSDGFMRRGDPHSRIAFCDASLHHFQPEDFDGKILIIDEVMSVLKSLICSDTCRNKRTTVLRRFKELCHRASRIVILDAGLADYAVEQIGIFSPDKAVVKFENIYQTYKWDVEFLTGTGSKEEGNYKPNDDSPIKAAIYACEGNFAVFADNQKGLEAIERELISQGKKGLRVDSTTTAEKEVIAFLGNPDKYLEECQPEYLLCSPSAESGLDISIKGYFSRVFFLGKGVVDVDSAMQMLGRVRDDAAKRVVFAPSRTCDDGIEYASTLWHQVIDSNKARLELAWKQTFNDVEDGDLFTDYLRHNYVTTELKDYYESFGKIHAQWNYERFNYRECLLERLQRAGHEVVVICGDRNVDCIDAKDKYKAAVNDIKNERSDAISKANLIPDVVASKYRQSAALKVQQRYELDKYNLTKKLPEVELGAELVRKIKFEKPKLLTALELIWMIDNPEVAVKISKSKWRYAIEQFGFWSGDKRDDLYLKAEALRVLRIKDFINPDIEWTTECPEFKEFKKRFTLAMGYKTINLETALNIKWNKKNPIKTLKSIFKMLGLSLTDRHRMSESGACKETYYKLNRKEALDPDRQLILEAYNKRFADVKEVEFEDLKEPVVQEFCNYYGAEYDEPQAA